MALAQSPVEEGLRSRPHQPGPLQPGTEPARALCAELKPPLTAAEALRESYRCLECGTASEPAPCTAACPSAVDVAGFIGDLARGDAESAGRRILRDNPLGGSCARVCPTEVLCEGACVLQHLGQRPVEVGRLQRYAMEHIPPVAAGRAARRRAGTRGRGRVAVIGAGPAGLACATVLAERGHDVTVFEARAEVGGLARFAIAPYRQLNEPLPGEAARLLRLGGEIRLGSPVDGPVRLRQLERDYDAIFLGVGLGRDADIAIDGDDLPGVHDSLPFIEALKTGRPLEVGPRVAVLGGGNTAIDVARECVRLGASAVTVLYRRTEAEMPAYRHEVAEARAEGVHFRWLTVAARVLGADRAEALECRAMALGEADASGRRRPQPVAGSEFRVPVDTVVKAMGQQPRADFLSWIPGLEVSGGRVVIDPTTARTGHPQYYAGGDAVNGGATVVEAVRLAKLAADAIDAAIQTRGAKRRSSAGAGQAEGHPAIAAAAAAANATTPATAATADGIAAAAPELAGPLAPGPSPAQDGRIVYAQGVARLTVIRDWCKGCRLCLDVCPPGILDLDPDDLIRVSDIDRCLFCGACAGRCPDFVFVLETGAEHAAVAAGAGA